MTFLLPECFGIKEKSIINKVAICSEEDVWKDDFIPPTQYYYVDSFGNHVYIRTRSRAVAQKVCDDINGKGFFSIKRVIKAVM